LGESEIAIVVAGQYSFKEINNRAVTTKLSSYDGSFVNCSGSGVTMKIVMLYLSLARTEALAISAFHFPVSGNNFFIFGCCVVVFCSNLSNLFFYFFHLYANHFL
jgi:hypothetical protein